ncbi:hypothetical protein ACFO6R_08430 [Eubacterium multiforme]|uniref:Uncharacterized protein n=1 Tax=Eubacterium multiforme TaxID=83339 RepID=A0ABT9UUT3_9FIRM|nr:hypothetical protein [Eubacterium multiforme]MDQ0150029.1 hypothetical protein [Eubacterium multiforme]
MDKQFKIYILDSSNFEQTLNYLYKKFGKDKIVLLSGNKIAIQYDYNLYDYKYLLEEMNKFPATQYIITANKFLNLLKSCMKKNLIIDEIRLIDIFKDDNEMLLKLISQINYNSSNNLKENLLDELNWLKSNEGIDIKYMSFRMQSDDKPIKIKFSLYDNGLLIIDDSKILDKVLEVIKCI